jgi:hypothetical protein
MQKAARMPASAQKRTLPKAAAAVSVFGDEYDKIEKK